MAPLVEIDTDLQTHLLEPLQEHAAKVAAKMEVLGSPGGEGDHGKAGRKSGVLSVSCKVFHLLDVERSIC